MNRTVLQKDPDIWECFDCNGRLGSYDEVIVCPFCGSEEIEIVV